MRKPGEVLSQWRSFIPSFNTSTLEFYAAVKKGLSDRKYPDISIEEVSYNEGGILSAKRAYLRVRRENLVFDICAAPFGVDFLFSCWFAELAPTFAIVWGCASVIAAPILLSVAVNFLGFWKGLFFGTAGIAALAWFIGHLARSGNLELEDTILAIPVIGWLYARLFKPITYYRIDTMIMFQEAVQAVVLAEIDKLREANGLKALAQDEREVVATLPYLKTGHVRGSD